MKTDKLTVACELLEQALRLYYEDLYFASLHLAGAAEELLGAHLKVLGKQSTFENFRTGGVEIANSFGDGEPMQPKDMVELLNHAKNRTKHMDSAEDSVITFDPAEQSRDLLDRAVSGYYHLLQYYRLAETPLIARFNAEIHRQRA